MKKLSLLLLVFSALLLHGAKEYSFKIAAKGEPVGYIAVEEGADRVIWKAARELQNYIKLITSAKPSIYNYYGNNTKNVIVLCTADSALLKPVLRGTARNLVNGIKDDGYAVLVRGSRI